MFSFFKKPEQQVEKSSVSLTLNVTAAAFTTLFAHPFRVLLNEASLHKGVMQTIGGAFENNKIFNNSLINLTRGTGSAFLQLYADDYAKIHFGQTGYLSKIGRIFSTVCAGLAVTPIETWFMRANAKRDLKNINCLQHHHSFRLKPLIVFFTAREFGFCISVFGSNYPYLYQQFPTLIPAALISAMAHKLVTIEVTKDNRQISHLVPNYKKGFKAVIRNISYGDTYEHHTFRVPIENPQNNVQLAYNFFSVTCGKNMFFWRLVYLLAFKHILMNVKDGINYFQYTSTSHSPE